MTLVLDTSVLLAALDLADEHHDRCRATLEERMEPRLVPAPVLVELEHMLRVRKRPAAWLGLAEDVAAGAYDVFHIQPDLVLSAARLQERYRDMEIGFVDAAVFLTCVELGETKVATLDRRHFSVLRTEDGEALRIVPE
jgi:hypothetical protein